jgi:group I intron endonuclease
MLLKQRKREHFTSLRNWTHPNRKLQAAWIKDGRHAFTWRILKYCPVEELIKTEQYYIDKYDAVNKGFNISPEAGKVTFGPAYLLRSRAKDASPKRSI